MKQLSSDNSKPISGEIKWISPHHPIISQSWMEKMREVSLLFQKENNEERN